MILLKFSQLVVFLFVVLVQLITIVAQHGTLLCGCGRPSSFEVESGWSFCWRCPVLRLLIGMLEKWALGPRLRVALVLRLVVGGRLTMVVLIDATILLRR